MLTVVLNEGLPLPDGCLPAIQQGAMAAAQVEGVSRPCAFSLTVVDDADMQAQNNALRGIDRSTDVLSFPTVMYPAGKTAGSCDRLLQLEYDDQVDACYLGDILLSLPRAETQAAEFGHSFLREVVYLVIHGVCHLFGYDHMNDQDKQRMRHMEETIMAKLGIGRDDLTDQDRELLEAAVQAMEHAYAPYSHYAVGSAILGTDGVIYTGCNVENASYGLTNCGERTAIFKAISEGCRTFTTIAIAARGAAPWPCGACRQVLNEFCPDIRVLVTWDGQVGVSTLAALLPHGFGPKQLLGDA